MTEKQLYAIGHPKGFVKIGVSRSPEDRCNDLQRACPYELWVISVIEQVNNVDQQPDPRRGWNTVEQAAHEYYYQCGVRGEWFDITPEEIDALGRLRSISLTEMWDVIYEQQARAWTQEPRDEYRRKGKSKRTLKYHIERARAAQECDVST